jgi:type I restriction enzyme S subunit
MAEQVSSLKTGIKYKDTPIGKIPVDWEVKRLEDTANNEKYSFTGGPFGSDLKEDSYTDDGVRVIQLQNIGDGKFLNEYKIFTSEEKAGQLKNCNIYPGDIIIAKMADPVARACIIPDEDKRYLMASDGIRLSINKEKYDVNFMLYAINSPNFRKNAESHSTGSTRLRIGLTELRNLLIAIPPLKDQKKIAEILTTVDEAIEKTAQVIETTKEVKNGLMQKLLTRGIGHKKFKETEIGEIPEEWEVVKLGAVADLKNGINFSKEQKSERGILTIDVLNMYSTSIFIDSTNLYRVNIDLRNKEDYILREGDILFVRSSVKREGVGWASLFKSFNEPATYCGFIIRARIHNKKLTPGFLIYFLRSNRVRERLISGAGQVAITNISQATLQNFDIVIPSLNEQKQIAEILSSVDEELEKESNHKEHLELLKKGLMQVLLTGKIRVS